MIWELIVVVVLAQNPGVTIEAAYKNTFESEAACKTKLVEVQSKWETMGVPGAKLEGIRCQERKNGGTGV